VPLQVWRGHQADMEMVKKDIEVVKKDIEVVEKDIDLQSALLKAEIYKTALDLGHHGDYERWRELVAGTWHLK
jgi:hypothetical protein